MYLNKIAIKISLIFPISIYLFVHADPTYKSEDYLHLLESLKSDNMDKMAPDRYNDIKNRGLELRPRLLELMRRVDLDRSGFGELNNFDLSILLHSQIDGKLAANNNNVDGLISLRIIIAQGNQIIRILYFDKYAKESKQELLLTHWARNFPTAMIDMHIPSDWKTPMKSDIVWDNDDLSWLNPVFEDPMPPVDYASEVLGYPTRSYIFEAIVIEDGTINYKWAIRSSHYTTGYHQNYKPIFYKFLEKVNESIDTK